MYRRADRDVLERECVADLDISVRAGNDLITDLEAVRCEDVALLAVNVVEQSDAGAAVRIVLDRSDASRDTVLRALEVDHAIEALMAAALMADGQAALLVTAAVLLQAFRQGLLRLACRDLIERCDRHEASACRIWFKTLYCHLNVPPFLDYASKNSMLSPAASFTMAFL